MSYPKSARNRFAAKAGRGFRRKPKPPMTPPDIDLVKLKEVSKEMAAMIERGSHVPSDEDKKAIAATMLKLAEENEAEYKEGYNAGLQAAKEIVANTPLAARKGDAP